MNYLRDTSSILASGVQAGQDGLELVTLLPQLLQCWDSRPVQPCQLTPIFMYVCMYVCMYVYIYLFIYCGTEV
jgi:hypothetical protein